MPTTTGTNEEIIEKKDTSPLATTCIIVATVALVAAIVFQLMELGELTEGLPASKAEALGTARYDQLIRAEVAAYESRVQPIIEGARVSEEDLREWQAIVDGTRPPPGSGAAGAPDRGTFELPSPAPPPGAIEPPPEDLGEFGNLDNP